MANSDKNIVIRPSIGSTIDQPSITFTGAGNTSITLKVLDDAEGTLSFEGYQGQVFAVNTNLSSGIIYSVNDISGLPLIDANADGTVRIGIYTGNVGIGTTLPTTKLDVVGDVLVTGSVTASSFSGNATSVIGGIASVTSLSVSGISTLGTVQISSGIVTATSGVVTYYGDGSQLSGIQGGSSISTETSNQAQYIPYATSFGSTTGLGATTLLVYNPSITSLGIGTTNPQANLHVVGDILVSGAVTTTDLIVKAPDNTDIFSVIGIGSTATDTIFEVTDFNDGTLLSATTDSNLLLSPTGAGYVGIGTTNPQQPFDVHVESRFQNGIRIGAANSTSYYKMEYNTVSQTLDISFFAS